MKLLGNRENAVFLAKMSLFPPPRPSENLDFLLFITVLRAYKAL